MARKDDEDYEKEYIKYKTVRIETATWKRLSQIKLDEGKETFDDLILDMIKDRGY